ncbi:hypothetical protein Tco_0255128 [Tanacetum coccineum]
MSARIAEEAALSPSSFRKRYRSSYGTPLPSSSLTFPIWKRYRGTSELEEDTEDECSDSDTEREGLEDEGPGSEEEEDAAPKGQQQAVPVVDTAADEPLGLGYGVWRRLSPLSPAVPTLVASPATTPATIIALDKDEFLEVEAQLELHGSILYDHTQCLDTLPPALFEGYDRDLRELYSRSRAVRDEIFSQRYRLRSLEQGHVDAQRAEIWQARYDDHRLIHDLLVHNTMMQRQLQEMRDRITILELEGSSCWLRLRTIFGLSATIVSLSRSKDSDDIRDIIMVTVRLKLLTFRFKNKAKVNEMLAVWNMHKNFRLYGLIRYDVYGSLSSWF